MLKKNPKNTRSYKLPPEIWKEFEPVAENLAARNRGVAKGDAVAVAMMMFLRLSGEEQETIMKRFRERPHLEEYVAEELNAAVFGVDEEQNVG